MKKILKTSRALPFLLALIVTVTFSYVVVHAQTNQSLSGDEVCGKFDPSANGGQGAITKPCTIDSLVMVMKNVLAVIIMLGLPLTVLFIAYRFVMAWFALEQGNANAYKEALKKSGNALLGFIFIVALFGGLLFAVLQYFGVKDSGALQLLKLFSDAFIPHAYAQDQLPNPIKANSLYDLILDVVRLIMKFFIYPALISIWVWTGFAFVFAQGRPDALTKAKKWLMWAFATTFVIFFLQAFLIAVQGTVQKILPSASQQQTTPAPAPYPITSSIPDGAISSVCTINGTYGTMGPNNECQVGRSAGSSNTTIFCQTKSVGTLCTLSGSTGTGVCRQGSGGTNECVLAQEKDFCLTVDSKNGYIDQFGQCVFGTVDGRTEPQEGQNGFGCLLNGKSGRWVNGTCYVDGVR